MIIAHINRIINYAIYSTCSSATRIPVQTKTRRSK
jgi:hypothetical protein